MPNYLFEYKDELIANVKSIEPPRKVEEFEENAILYCFDNIGVSIFATKMEVR